MALTRKFTELMQLRSGRAELRDEEKTSSFNRNTLAMNDLYVSIFDVEVLLFCGGVGEEFVWCCMPLQW